MTLDIVIPAHNEVGSIHSTIESISSALTKEKIEFNMLVVNDHSTDGTLDLMNKLSKQYKNLKVLNNTGPNGFGMAIRFGLERITGDCVAILMADLSDDPEDLISFYNKMKLENYDCVFGTRFSKGGYTIDYPVIKKILNRFFNSLIRILFGLKYNDTTNAFKLYKRTTIEGLKPFLSPHFNLTVELPLKAIIRGYSYTILPNSWRNRKFGESKLKIREMGSRYFFILLYCLIEKYFSRGDYAKK
jgi:dolichol-phosphate mannosyltransferase